MTHTRSLSTLAASILLLLSAGCGSGEDARPSTPDGAAAPGVSAPVPGPDAANVLVLCVDVLRADHVGAYGHDARTTPWFDRLARSGVTFETVTSAASWTKPSVPSYFTGRYPHQHGVYEGSREVAGGLVSDVLPEEETTIAELYRSAGFRTAAFVHNAQINGELGFDQGFERYDDDSDDTGDAIDIGDRFLGWVDGLDGEAFFSYLHFLDVHWPYDPPDGYRDLFDPAPTEIDFATPAWRVLKRKIREGEIRLSDTERRSMKDLYDGELRFTDAAIGRILAGLRSRGMFDRTLVVLLSDHGEEFLEHGKIGHGNSLYDELLRVPLIMRFPGDTYAGVRIEQPASLVDVLPTLAEFSGLPTPAGVAGRSLLPLLRSDSAPSPRHLYSEGIHGSQYQQTVRADRWKYIASVEIDRHDPDDDEDEVRDSIGESVRVEVEGVWVRGSDFLAEEVEVQEDQEDDRDKVTGPITAVASDRSWIEVLGYRVEITEGLDIEDHEGKNVDVTELAEDVMVKVYGRALSPETLRAEKIKLRDPSRRRKIKVEGAIAGAVRREGSELVFELGARTVRADSRADFAREITDSPEAAEKVIRDPGFEDPWQAAISSGASIREELYDLATDPGERRNLALEREQEITVLRESLGRRRADAVGRRHTGKKLSDRELEALRAMGYVE